MNSAHTLLILCLYKFQEFYLNIYLHKLKFQLPPALAGGFVLQDNSALTKKLKRLG